VSLADHRLSDFRQMTLPSPLVAFPRDGDAWDW
jgi:hypothetical protein